MKHISADRSKFTRIGLHLDGGPIGLDIAANLNALVGSYRGMQNGLSNDRGDES